MHQKTNAYIRSVGAHVPERRVSNAELSTMVDTSDEWIYSHTGIRNRHIASDKEGASDLAAAAAVVALSAAGMPASDIDMVLVATSTPDYIGFPSTASIVQQAIGAGNAGAMDVFAACTGFIYGLETAKCYVEAGIAENVLVIGSEVLSRMLDWKDRNTCVLFGDGAGAVIVSASGDHKESGIASGILRSDGRGADYLLVAGGGSRRPETMEKIDHPYIRMNGRQVYNFAVKALCDTVTGLLEKNSVRIEDVAYIVPHQANMRIIEAAGKRMKIPLERFYTNMAEYANTSAASIPIALYEMARKDLLRRGTIILTIGFGGGLTYGGNLIRW